MNGLKSHIKLVLQEGQEPASTLDNLTKRLKSLGGEPEPQPVRGFGGGGGGKPQGKELPMVEGETCSVCGGPVVEKQWPAKDGSKNYRKWECKNYNCQKNNGGYGKFKKHKEEILPLLDRANSDIALSNVARLIKEERFFEPDRTDLENAYKRNRERIKAGA